MYCYVYFEEKIRIPFFTKCNGYNFFSYDWLLERDHLLFTFVKFKAGLYFLLGRGHACKAGAAVLQ